MSRWLDFEQDVFRAVSAILNPPAGSAGQVGTWKVYHSKGYHSRDRDGQIVVDVAAEFFLKGARRPSIIWLWECKNYAAAVPVSDVEEFHSKIQQIGEDNTKGTLVSSGPVQRSVLTYALSKGIGIARLFSDNQIEWVIHLAAKPVNPYQALCDSDFNPQNTSLVGFTSRGAMVSGGLPLFLTKEIEPESDSAPDG